MTNFSPIVRRWIEMLASIPFTLVCLILLMMLVFFGTLAQVNLGTFAAQQKYFNSVGVWAAAPGGTFQIPVFPGGLLVGGLWLVNLAAAFWVKFTYRKKDAGLLLSHAGIFLLVLGQGLTQLNARESRLVFEEGQTRAYAEAYRRFEMALVDTSGKETDEVTAIPESLLRSRRKHSIPGKPIQVRVLRFFPNSALVLNDTPFQTPVTRGVRLRVAAMERPPVFSDDEIETVSAWVEVFYQGLSKGVWLLSSGLGDRQGFIADGRNYEMVIRHARDPLPFSLTLKDFTHDRYPGTDIPKNFSSLVRLKDPANQEDRDALIYMNHPLRYGGRTFYQASFGKDDTLSVLQVVENPYWLTPYLACAMVLLGLGIQFLSHLIAFTRKRTWTA